MVTAYGKLRTDIAGHHQRQHALSKGKNYLLHPRFILRGKRPSLHPGTSRASPILRNEQRHLLQTHERTGTERDRPKTICAIRAPSAWPANPVLPMRLRHRSERGFAYGQAKGLRKNRQQNHKGPFAHNGIKATVHHIGILLRQEQRVLSEYRSASPGYGHQ